MNDQTGTDAHGKPGAEPTDDLLWLAERRGDAIDSRLLARSDGVAIWQTDKSAIQALPRWRPPFGVRPSGLYRGFPIENLHEVLSYGLDVPPQSAFFATAYPDKAWEYPQGRNLAAMLVLDFDQAERSWIATPAQADHTWQPDKTDYPNEYLDDGDQLIHTRFERDRGSRIFSHESRYGFWVPGDAREALIAVVLGGPEDTMRLLLERLAGSCSYSLDLAPFGETDAR